MTTQNDSAILAALQSGSVLTPAIAATRWGCLALHSAIARLRKLGHNIPCRMVTNNDRRHGEYRYVAPHDGKDVKPAIALPCASSADRNSRPDHGIGEQTGTNRELHHASAAPDDDVMVTRYYVKAGKEISYQYVVSGYANGKPAR